jgi:hypothetical protein
MFPNLFLKTFWEMDLRPQIFVAMSFAEVYQRRFEDVIAPAISNIRVGNVQLQPYRVDTSKSGDSILTDIIDGIAHCQMFLADISLMGCDSKTGQGYRNSNVLYEVGLAVGCRQPSEILLVRDDRDRFLFDVSTIPHLFLDFTQTAGARQRLQEELIERLRGRNLLKDARVHRALAQLTTDELEVIQRFGNNQPPRSWGFRMDGSVNFLAMAAIPRLCDKQMIHLVGKWTIGGAAFRWTTLGFQVAQLVLKGLPAFEPAQAVVPIEDAAAHDHAEDSDAAPAQ